MFKQILGFGRTGLEVSFLGFSIQLQEFGSFVDMAVRVGQLDHFASAGVAGSAPASVLGNSVPAIGRTMPSLNTAFILAAVSGKSGSMSSAISIRQLAW